MSGHLFVFRSRRGDRLKILTWELLTQYIAYLKAQRKPSAYVIEKCVEANKKTPSRVNKVPHIPKSGEDNVRLGFSISIDMKTCLSSFHVPLRACLLSAITLAIGKERYLT